MTTDERERNIWEVATTAIYKHIDDIEKRLTMAINQSSKISSMVSERHKDALQEAMKGILDKLGSGERRFDYIEKDINDLETKLCGIKNKDITEIKTSLIEIKKIINVFETFKKDCPNHIYKISDIIKRIDNIETIQKEKIKSIEVVQKERIDNIETIQKEQTEKCDWHKLMTAEYEVSWKELPNIINLYQKFKTYRILIIGIGLGILIMSGMGGVELLKVLVETFIKIFIH